MALEVGMGEGPRGFGKSHGNWEGRGSSRRPSVEQAFVERFGVSINEFLALKRKKPELFVSLQSDIERLIQEKATREDVIEYFRQQEKLNGAIADEISGSADWKDTLLKIRDELPKSN